MVSLGGQPLTAFVQHDFGSIKEYGADISGFAGQTAELRFSQISGPGVYNNIWFDNISFSDQPIVPEPSTWALFALGGAACWCATRRRK